MMTLRTMMIALVAFGGALSALLAILSTVPARADDRGGAGVALQYTRAELEQHWKARIQTLLDQGKLPKIDMESSIQQGQVERFVPAIFAVMDELGVALIAADGYQDPKDGRKGYRWSTYIRDLVNRYPERFIPTANGGTNPNWLAQKGGQPQDFIDQMEAHVRAGLYAHMGEMDFRHYMSSSQCKQDRFDRDSDIALNSENGHRVFRLAAQTGVPFAIHLEPEDAALAALQEMLATYPEAKVIVGHFGQVRHPEVQTHFTPDAVRKLLSAYPNLYYDLSTGGPNRQYTCAGPDRDQVLKADTVLWVDRPGYQGDTLKDEWRAILNDFSDHFVFATDYGGGRSPLDVFLRHKVANFERITAGLSDQALHNIAYKNAWKLLTGQAWSK